MPIIAEHWWRVASEAALWAAGLAAAISLLLRLPPVQWLWRQTVTRPVSEWNSQVVGKVVEDKTLEWRNATDSVKSQFDAFATCQTALTASVKETIQGQDDIKAALDNIHHCIDRRFADTHERMEKLTAYTEEVLSEAVGSKERIRQLYRALEVPVFETDARGWFTYINPAYSRLTGLSVEEAMGGGWVEAVAPQDRSGIMRVWGQAIQLGVDFTGVHHFRNAITGDFTEARISATPLHDGSKQVVGWVGTIDPIGPPGTLLEIESAKQSIQETEIDE